MKNTTVALQIRSASGRPFRRAGYDFTDAPRVLFLGPADKGGHLTPDQADAILATPALAVLELDQAQAADAAAALPRPAPSEAEIRQQYAERLEQLELKLMRLTAAGDAPAAAERIAKLEQQLAQAQAQIAKLERREPGGGGKDKDKADAGGGGGGGSSKG